MKQTRAKTSSTPTADRVPAVEPISTAAIVINKRLLVVEDNEGIARTILLLLTQLKVQAERVGSGDDAYQLLKNDSAFDAVLSDIQMPGTMDGHALANKIREEYPHIVVVLMTGYKDTGAEVTGFPTLQKPFNIRQLTECLAKLLA